MQFSTTKRNLVPNGSGTFAVECPVDWKGFRAAELPQLLHISSADKTASVTASAYEHKNNMNLRQFADTRLSLRDDYLTSCKPERSFANGVFQEFSGLDPDTGEQVYYTIGAMMNKDGFFSFSIITPDADYFPANEANFVRIMQSSMAIQSK